MPDKQPLNELLNLYESIWCKPRILFPEQDLKAEQRCVDLFRDFLNAHEDPFVRACAPGHFTGSALVVDSGLEQVLLTHHKKLDKWLQLGGHADGDTALERVALNEVREESGLTTVSFFEFGTPLDVKAKTPIPFDLDCHIIPARKSDPAHKHFDVRFVLISDSRNGVIVSDESHDVRWFSLKEARQLTDEWSMHRQFLKLEALRQLL